MIEYKDSWNPKYLIEDSLYRGVAQLVEHTAGGRVVARSNRVAPTFYDTVQKTVT